MTKKAVVFVDGENLVIRYQEMVKAGRVPKAGVTHAQGFFVWSSDLFSTVALDLLRINYYTHVVGGDEKVAEITTMIANTQFSPYHSAHLIPRVHKKPANSPKSKVVDVDITMDVMRAALMMPIDVIVLLSGDSDYVPLVREVARSTSKQVYLGAFSSGLAKSLRSCAEQFTVLDDDFFEHVPGKFSMLIKASSAGESDAEISDDQRTSE